MWIAAAANERYLNCGYNIDNGLDLQGLNEFYGGTLMSMQKTLAKNRPMLESSSIDVADTQLNVAVPEFDQASRADSYAAAHSQCPEARSSERKATVAALGDIANKIVLEIGAGQGFLTTVLAELVGPKGLLIAVDNSSQQLNKLASRCRTVKCIKSANDKLSVPSNSVDAIVSLANFHHTPRKREAFLECARVLRSGGRFVLVDVADRTPTQRYFDEVVDKICSTGHAHSFLNRQACESYCRDAGMKMLSWELKSVPWKFPSETVAGLFLQNIHDAAIAPEFCWQKASNYLGFSHEEGGISLGWELFFMVAESS